MSVSAYASDFAITVSPTGDTITVSTEPLWHLDEVDADRNVVAYICCAQSPAHARSVRRREARERQIPVSRIAISRGAA